MQDPDDVSGRLRDLVAGIAHVPPAQVTPERRLRDDLGINSLTMIDLAVAVEDRFGIRISDDAAERFQTVRDIMTTLQATHRS